MGQLFKVIRYRLAYAHAHVPVKAGNVLANELLTQTQTRTHFFETDRLQTWLHCTTCTVNKKIGFGSLYFLSVITLSVSLDSWNKLRVILLFFPRVFFTTLEVLIFHHEWKQEKEQKRWHIQLECAQLLSCGKYTAGSLYKGLRWCCVMMIRLFIPLYAWIPSLMPPTKPKMPQTASSLSTQSCLNV
jgi:hypothetical protein